MIVPERSVLTGEVEGDEALAGGTGKVLVAVAVEARGTGSGGVCLAVLAVLPATDR